MRNHPFLDGNKRTAVLATLMFYGYNRLWLNAEQGEIVGLAVDVAEGILDVHGIAGRLKSWAVPLHLHDDPAEA